MGPKTARPAGIEISSSLRCIGRNGTVPCDLNGPGFSDAPALESEVEDKVAATSNPIDLGSQAPDFELPDGNGRPIRLRDKAGSAGTLVIFICNHCPYVLHMRDALQRYAQDYASRGIGVIAINPNDPVAYPQESPEHVAEVARHLAFPYLIDTDQKVARAYNAACTPDPYLYDAQLRLYYHGQFDATRPGITPATGADLRQATERLLAAKPALAAQAASIGCSIKWKPGSEPR